MNSIRVARYSCFAMAVHVLVAAFLAVLAALLTTGTVRAEPVDVPADIIWDDADAKGKCPGLCTAKGLYWMGTWRKVGFVETTVCTCDNRPPPPPPTQSFPPQQRPILGVIQMPPGGPQPTQSGGVLRYDNTYLIGNDLRNLPARSVDECIGQCFGAADCRAFSFAMQQNRCYLKSAPGDMQPNRTAISGVVQPHPALSAPPAGAMPMMPPQGGTSCSIASTQKCPGCSVACGNGQRAVCEPAVEGVTSWCARNAACECR